jgi:hypothetical protein
VVVTLIAVGCGDGERTLTPSDRAACERVARQAGASGSPAFKGALDDCLRNVLHPERGGG